MDRTTGPVNMEVDREGLGIETYREELLPGLPDHLTFGEIAAKLQWKSLCSLAPVSPAWVHAMRNHEVYDARVFYCALESLVLLRSHRNGSDYDRLRLYSSRDGLYFKLPPLPVCEPGIPRYCECVMLDGKI